MADNLSYPPNQYHINKKDAAKDAQALDEKLRADRMKALSLADARRFWARERACGLK